MVETSTDLLIAADEAYYAFCISHPHSEPSGIMVHPITCREWIEIMVGKRVPFVKPVRYRNTPIYRSFEVEKNTFIIF